MYEIPVCFNYIKKDLPYPRSDYLYSIFYHAHKSKYPTEALDDDTLFQVLRLTPEWSSETQTVTLITGITCFTIACENNCNWICKLCPYCPSYRNGRIDEERILLSYMIQSRENIRFLSALGIKDIHFTALISLLESEPPFIFSLHRMFYRYLTQKVNHTTNFQTIPMDFINELKIENQDKIGDRNKVILETYLCDLQKNTPSKETIRNLLKTSFLLPLDKDKANSYNNSRDTSKSQEPAVKPNNNDNCISGLLTSPEVKKPNPVKTQPQRSKENISTPPSAGGKPTIKIESSKTAPLPEITNINKSTTSPYYFNFQGIQKLTNKSTEIELMILDHLLALYPIIGLEILTDYDTKEECFLLYLGETYYYFSAHSSSILDHIMCYMDKSKLRTIVCFYAFRLYHFFTHNSRKTTHIFSIHTAYGVFSNNKKGKNPEKIMKELVSKEKRSVDDFYLYAMPQYFAAWDVLLKGILKQKEGMKCLVSRNNVNCFFGYSYYLSEITETTLYLFDLTLEGNYQFNYSEQMELKEYYLSYTYFFEADKSEQMDKLIKNLISVIANQKIFINHFLLLSKAASSITFAVKKDSYDLLKELINNISTYLASKLGLIPITIIEQKN